MPASPLERVGSSHTPCRALGLPNKCLGEFDLTGTESQPVKADLDPGLFHIFTRFENFFSSQLGPELRESK